MRLVRGSACSRAAGSISSTPRHWTSRSKTSPMASGASRAGTGKLSANTSSRWRSTRYWSKPSVGSYSRNCLPQRD